MGLQQKAQAAGLPTTCIYAKHQDKQPSSQPAMNGITNHSRFYIIGHGLPGSNEVTGTDDKGKHYSWNAQETIIYIAKRSDRTQPKAIE